MRPRTKEQYIEKCRRRTAFMARRLGTTQTAQPQRVSPWFKVKEWNAAVEERRTLRAAAADVLAAAWTKPVNLFLAMKRGFARRKGIH
jgi:hypothetical protein